MKDLLKEGIHSKVDPHHFIHSQQNLKLIWNLMVNNEKSFALFYTIVLAFCKTNKGGQLAKIILRTLNKTLFLY